jgi:N-acetylglucosaminyldiphosphoundecaprenol N-acetyl-beta-D-mannosaminyltransferase
MDQPPSRPIRVDILGTSIATTSYAEVLEAIGRPPADRAQLFAFCNVHSVMTARRDHDVRAALDLMDTASPDGMPLVWVLRRRGRSNQTRVYGPDLMELAFPYGVDLGWEHFFFGTTDETLDRLTDSARRLAPGVRIVGRYAPPYRPLTPAEGDDIIDRIRGSGANVVWVGLGMPKQELWMQSVRERLPGISLMGVGAAFDLLSGTVPQAPDWIQDRGLEWAYRLWREPRRLWRRYLINNPSFLFLATVETLRIRFAHNG